MDKESLLIKWDELAPSLQAIINAKLTKDDIPGIVNQAVAKTTTLIQDNTKDIKKYVDDMDFTNSNPKIGFLDTDNKAPVFAAFNISFMELFSSCMIEMSDIEGRKNLFFLAAPDDTVPIKIFRGYKLSESDNYSFENEPLLPKYLGGESTDTSKYYLNRIFSITTEYIVAGVVINGVQKYHVILTNYSGSVSNWTSYIDITALMLKYNNVESILYFSEYKTFGVFWFDKNKAKLDVCNSNFDKMKSITLLDLDIDYTVENHKVVIMNLAMWAHTGSMACFIPSLNRILFHFPIRACYYDSNGLMTAYYYTIRYLGVYDVNPGFWGNNDQAINNKSQTLHRTGNEPVDASGWLSIAYDDFDDCIRYGIHWQDNAICQMVETKLSDCGDPTAGLGYFGKKNIVSNLTTPDTCPWAKKQYCPYIIGNTIIINSASTKYGSVKAYVDIETASNTNKLSIRAGSWQIIPSDHFIYNAFPNAISCIKTDSYNYKWHLITDRNVYEICYNNRVCSNGNNIQDVIYVHDKGISYDPSSIPSDLEICSRLYSPNDNKLYLYAQKRDKTICDPSSTYGCLLEYDINSSTVTNRINGYSTQLKNIIDKTAAADVDGRYPELIPLSNMFMDNDNAIYLGLEIYAAVGGYERGGACVIKMNIHTNTVSTPIIQYTAPWCGAYTIGYNNKFGYYYTYSSSTYYRGDIISSKDIVNGKQEYSKEQFFAGNYYNTYFGLTGSTGLIAYVQSFSVMLGGYYSVVPAQELYLKPNADNYIYASRDRTDRTAVTLKVYTKLMGGTGSSHFSNIPLAKITTDANGPISQKIYTYGGGSSGGSGSVNYSGEIVITTDDFRRNYLGTHLETFTVPFNLYGTGNGGWFPAGTTLRWYYYDIPSDGTLLIFNATQGTGSGDDNITIGSSTGFLRVSDGTIHPIPLSNYYEVKAGWRVYWGCTDTNLVLYV